VEFIKKYAYVFLCVVCVLALGGLFLMSRNRPTGVVETRPPIVPLAEVHAAEPPVNDYTVYQPISGDDDLVTLQEQEPTEPIMVMVHIVGAVRYPGVFEVPYGSRINDILQLAGGYSEDANQGQINLSAFVQDAMQIRIPAIGEEIQEPTVAGQPASQNQPAQQAQQSINADGLININLASLSELQTLQGIGPVLAQNIIDYRETHGGFNNIEDLLNVNRIGPATFDNIRDRITVE